MCNKLSALSLKKKNCIWVRDYGKWIFSSFHKNQKLKSVREKIIRFAYSWNWIRNFLRKKNVYLSSRVWKMNFFLLSQKSKIKKCTCVNNSFFILVKLNTKFFFTKLNRAFWFWLFKMLRIEGSYNIGDTSVPVATLKGKSPSESWHLYYNIKRGNWRVVEHDVSTVSDGRNAARICRTEITCSARKLYRPRFRLTA